MSILIKGVDMPKSGESTTYSSKEIIKIPTPHGRLIDADNLHRCIKAMLGDSDVIAIFESIIQCQPTIIEAEASE